MTTVLPADIDAAGQQRGEADRPARLDHQLQLPKRKSHRRADFRVGSGDALREQPAVDGEGDFAGDQGHQRIADAVAFSAMRLAFSRAQRTRMIVKGFRFGRHQLGPRIARLDRGSDAGHQAAAGGRRHHDVGRDAKCRHVVGDFPPHRTLAGDHQGIVIGRYQRGAALAGDVAGDGFAVLAVAVVQHDLGAIGLGALALGERRVGGHHDGRLHVQDPRRRRHALGVIAGRERDHAAAARAQRDRRQLVEGAAELERSGPLQHFRFQEDPGSDTLVERGR